MSDKFVQRTDDKRLFKYWAAQVGLIDGNVSIAIM